MLVNSSCHMVSFLLLFFFMKYKIIHFWKLPTQFSPFEWTDFPNTQEHYSRSELFKCVCMRYWLRVDTDSARHVPNDIILRTGLTLSAVRLSGRQLVPAIRLTGMKSPVGCIPENTVQSSAPDTASYKPSMCLNRKTVCTYYYIVVLSNIKKRQ